MSFAHFPRGLSLVATAALIVLQSNAHAAEAEMRRLERFQVISPSPSANIPPPEEPNPIFPGTLDMRVPPQGPPSRTQAERLT